MTRWSVLVGETVTGKVIKQHLPCTVQGWSDSLDYSSPTQLQITCPLEDQTSVDTARAVASGKWRTTLIACYDGRPIVAGPVLKHSVSENGQSASIGCGGLAAIFAKRAIIAPGFEGDPENPDADVYLGPSSLAAIARQLITNAITGTGKSLPLELPTLTTAESIGDYTREYLAAETYVGEALSKLVKDDTGPDIHFKPFLAGDRRTFGWEVRIGRPHLVQNARPRVWATGGAGSGIGEEGDATEQAMRVYVPSQAQTQQQNGGPPPYAPVGLAEDLDLLDLGYPLLERIERSEQQDPVAPNTDWLSAQALDLVRVYGTSRVEHPVTMQGDFPARLGEFDLGDIGFVRVTKHNWIERGDGPMRRVLSISGTASDQYNLGLLDPLGAEDGF